MKNACLKISILLFSVILYHSIYASTYNLINEYGEIKCIDINGNIVKNEMIKIDGRTYFFDENGYQVKNYLYKNSKLNICYFDERDGYAVYDKDIVYNDKMKANFNVDGEYTFHFNNECICDAIYKKTPFGNINVDMKLKWVKTKDGYTYQDYNGDMIKGRLMFIDHDTYYFDEYGIRKDNFVLDYNGKKRYFGDDGKEISNPNIKDDTKKIEMISIDEFKNNLTNEIVNATAVSYYPNDVTVDDMDVVHFGRINQDNNVRGKEEIEWIVLEKDENTCLLLSKYILLLKNYLDEEKICGNLHDCSFRSELDNDIYKNSFNEDEKDMILEDDKVYVNMLSPSNFRKYFGVENKKGENIKAATRPTKAVLDELEPEVNGDEAWYNGNLSYFLNPYSNRHTICDYKGYLYKANEKAYTSYPYYGIRPMIKIKYR